MKSLTDLQNDWKQASNTYRQLDKDTPRIIGEIGVEEANMNFRNQSYNGVPWKERSQVTNKIYDERGSKKGSVYSSSNPILVQTGNLKDSIRYIASANRVNIGVNLNQTPYAKINNEGGSKLFGKKWVRIPKRQFLGYSKRLAARIKLELANRRRKALSKFVIAK